MVIDLALPSDTADENVMRSLKRLVLENELFGFWVLILWVAEMTMTYLPSVTVHCISQQHAQRILHSQP